MKLRVLFVIDELGAGGKQRRFLEFLSFLRNQRIDFSVIILSSKNDVHYRNIFELCDNLIFIDRLKISYYKSLKIILDQAESFKPNILHVWDFMSFYYTFHLKIFTKLKLVSNLIADAKPMFKNNFHKILFKLSVFGSKVVISNTKVGLKNYGCEGHKFRVVNNGVNLSRFDKKYNESEIKSQYKIKANHIVVMVANFTNRKDYNSFIDTAKDVNSLIDSTLFVGIGDGPLFKNATKRVKDENIKNILFTGVIHDVEKILSICDLGVLFTNRFSGEGISNSIIEYMAMGLPVVTNDVFGGSREIIKSGHNGYILENNFSEIISKVLMNHDLSKRLGDNAKKEILNNFTIAKMGKKYLDIYKTIS
jgi:glycosyltransferase involved in cell wall biosynthesis